jgi:hypothetical protein
MNTSTQRNDAIAIAEAPSSVKNSRFSFSSFQKAIRENSELRKQVRDIVDLGLFEYAIQRNSAFIQSIREKAEAESLDLMMRFAKGIDDYTKLEKKIHKNRIIRTLAIMDRKAQMEIMNKFNRLTFSEK